MPVVPQASPTVQSRPLDPGFQNASAASLDAFGALQGAAMAQTGARLQGVSDELHRLALKTMVEDNEREAGKLDVELSSALRSVTRGDGTQQNPGYFGLKGEAALQGYEGAQKAIREAQKKLSESAKNPRVKEMFDRVASRRIETEMDRLASHVGQERVRAADTVSEARLSEAANDAAAAWNDPKIISRSVGLAVNEVRSMAERNGWGKEVEAAKVREATSVIATGAAKAALAVEATGAAQRIFKQYEGSFTPEARAQISRQIRDGSVQHSAQALRDAAIAAHPGDLAKQAEFIRQKASGKVEDAAMASISTWHSIQRASEADRERVKDKAKAGEAQSRFDMIVEQTSDPKERIRLARALPADLRDNVEQRLRSEENFDRREKEDTYRVEQRAIQEIELKHRLEARQEKEARDQARSQALEAIRNGTPLSKLPSAILDKLDRNDYVGLEKIERDTASGHPPATDFGYFHDVMSYSAAKLADVNITEAASKLAPREFNQLVDRVTKARNGELDASVGTPNQMVQAKIKELGLTGDDAKRKRAGQLQSLFLEQMAAETKANGGKRVSQERTTEILNGLIDTVAVPGKLWGTNDKTAFTVLSEIKQPDRERISSRLRAAGLTPTAKNIIEYHNREQERAKGSR